MVILRLIWESLLMSIQSVTTNRLRALLSLLGITIGIFAIIAVFTIVDSLEINIRESVNTLGNDLIYVEKWPWTQPEGESEYPWWKYMNRPQPTLEEYEYLKEKVKGAKQAAFITYVGRRLEYGNNSIEGAGVVGVTDGFKEIRSFEVASGRYFSPLEMLAGRNVGFIGSTIAKELFGGADPVGKHIEVFGAKMLVIGVAVKEGQGTFGGQVIDDIVITPLNFFRNFVDIRYGYANPQIWIQARPRVGVKEMEYELIQHLRSIRRLKPMDEDNFALNQTSMITKQLDQLFAVLKVAGLIIGGFSIIVGGFGIANIMFVSVKERTHIIGIQKALGAKRFFILLQFLFESIMLSVTGGIIGLLIIFILVLLVNSGSEFTMYLTSQNIVLGIAISSAIGLISGIFPAWQGARMDPVVAINTTF